MGTGAGDACAIEFEREDRAEFPSEDLSAAKSDDLRKAANDVGS